MRSFSILFIFLLFFSVESLAQNLTVESTFHSAGYYLNDLFSLSTKYSIQVKFKSDTSTTWRDALPPSDIELNGNRKILGSILLLTPNTKYDLEVTIIDSFPTIHTLNLQAKFTTREELPSSWTINNALWVSPGGTGHEYTQSNPGSISTLLTSDKHIISCGTQVNCLGGVYHVGEFSLSLPASTSDCGDNPIIFTSAPGESAIFDGSDTSSLARQPAWILADSAQYIYTTNLPPTAAWSTLLIYQGKRLFPYAFIYPQYLFGKVFNETLVNANNYFGSGFYHNGTSFAIKLENGEDPNGKELIVSKFNSFLNIDNNAGSNTPPLIIKDLTFRYYGRANVLTNIFGMVTADYGAEVIRMNNLKRTIIDHCRFEFNTASIKFSGHSDSTIVQNCSFRDQTGLWSHGAFKNTSLAARGDLNAFFDNGKFGRILETSGIFYELNTNEPMKNIIIRNNTIDGLVSAMSGRTVESSPISDVDIYHNTLLNNYDAIDEIGNALNYRIWGNEISNCPVVFSMIPFKDQGQNIGIGGPAYIFRNVVQKIPSRHNILNSENATNPYLYINYNGCLGLKPATWGSALKMETGDQVTNPRTDVHFYHNTFAAEDSLAFNFYLYAGTWRSIQSSNNIYYSKHTNVNFEGVMHATHYGFHSIGDDYYSELGPIGVINGMHGNVSTCSSHNTLESLDLKLREVTGNADTSKLKIVGHQLNPDFVNLSTGDLHLLEHSAMVDLGTLIPNISDLSGINYFGTAPDLGAYEMEGGMLRTHIEIPNSTHNLLIIPNPNNGDFEIRNTNVFTHLQIISFSGQIILNIALPSTYHYTMPKNTLQSGAYYCRTLNTQHHWDVTKLLIL